MGVYTRVLKGFLRKTFFRYTLARAMGGFGAISVFKAIESVANKTDLNIISGLTYFLENGLNGLVNSAVTCARCRSGPHDNFLL